MALVLILDMRLQTVWIFVLVLPFKKICVDELRGHVTEHILRLKWLIAISWQVVLDVVLDTLIALLGVYELSLKHFDVVQLIVILLKKLNMLPKILFVQNSSRCDRVNIHSWVWSILGEDVVDRRVHVFVWRESRRVLVAFTLRSLWRCWVMDWFAIGWNRANCSVESPNIWTLNLQVLMKCILIEAA